MSASTRSISSAGDDASGVASLENPEVKKAQEALDKDKATIKKVKIAVMTVATLGMTVFAIAGGVSSVHAIFSAHSSYLQAALGVGCGIASTAGSYLLIERLPKWIKGDEITKKDLAILGGMAVYGAGGFITSAIFGAHGFKVSGIVVGTLSGPVITLIGKYGAKGLNNLIRKARARKAINDENTRLVDEEDARKSEARVGDRRATERRREETRLSFSSTS
ncbi:MAG: hypothetical protein KR126chlam6_00071 [Candidatus Anoxychlamydiales bacterium]|nr:hypothetical protein [Candidatus Anoxychlamydiales bacterium]